jgi:hypothetical protein
MAAASPVLSRSVARLCCAALICVVTPLAACSGVDHDPDVIQLRPPATDREREAARHALSFAALLQRGDAPAACGLARGAAWRMLRCARNPRSPRWLRIPSRQRLEVVHVSPAEVRGAILRLGIPGRGPLLLAFDVDADGHVLLVSHYGFG